jgi:hypothetical protein
MRKLSVLLVVPLLLSLALPAYAQKRIGIIGGVNLATLSIDSLQADYKTKNSAGIAIGLAGDVAFTPNVMIRIEPMYMMKGAKFERSDNTKLGKLKLSYIDVPVELKLMFGTSRARPYVLGGPSVGFLVSAKRDSLGSDTDVKSNYKSTELGLVGGVGLAFTTMRHAVFIEGRYQLGLEDIRKDNAPRVFPSVASGQVKNQGFQILIGAMFGGPAEGAMGGGSMGGGGQ